VKKVQKFFDIFLGNLVVLGMLATLVTLMIMYKNLSSTVQNMSKVMIQGRLNLTEQGLSNIINPINRNLKTTRERGRKGLFSDMLNQRKLNDIFIPYLKNSPSISALMLANDRGDEYRLFKTDSLWIVRLTQEGSKNATPTDYFWEEKPTGESILLDQKTHPAAYDPRTRPWYKLAIKSQIDSISHWTSPYTFFTSKKPGITASIKWQDGKTGQHIVFGIDLLIDDISDFTTAIDITENGKIFILSDSAQVIGLPKDERFADKKSRQGYTLKKLNELDIPVLDEAIQTFYNDQSIFSFRFKNKIWWAGIQAYQLSNSNTLSIGAVVPESDFSQEMESTRQLLVGGFVMILLFFLIILYSFLRMKIASKIIAIEKDKNEQMLLNILPRKVVNDLKQNGISLPQKFKNVTVFFSDIVDFTRASSQLDPDRIIKELNQIYTAFDEIMIKYDCERIKTIGDAYLAVCGMPQQNERHAEMMLKASLEVMSYIEKRNASAKIKWEIRIGMHSGNVVGGIVGVKKYIYDIFGDTINTASRMENNSSPMRINISDETYLILNDSEFIKSNHIIFEERAPIQVKGKGKMTMYFVST
jgi:class 3 adenylate cyclase